MKADGITHPALLEQVALRDDCIDYHDVFRSLGASRKWTQVGPEPLQTTEIKAELELRGIDDHYERLKYLRIVRKLDRVELDYHFERLKKK